MVSVSGLCKGLIQHGHDVRVITSDANGKRRLTGVVVDQMTEWEGIPVLYCRRTIPESISLKMLQALPSNIHWADVVHLTGVYNFPTFPVLHYCRQARKPLVWSPRGALQRWAGSRRVIAKAMWNRLAKAVAPGWMHLHATDEAEAEESRPHIGTFDWDVVPNGVSIPTKLVAPVPSATLRVLFLGRLDPKKGIPILIESISELSRGVDPLPVEVTIAGAGPSEYTEYLFQMCRQFGVVSKIKFVGEVDSTAKGQLFASTDVSVFPSHTENFGIVVAESLAHSVPVIVSPNMPWASVVNRGCGLVSENTPRALAANIRKCLTLDLPGMGSAGRQWMVREFSWNRRAAEMATCYERALSRMVQCER